MDGTCALPIPDRARSGDLSRRDSAAATQPTRLSRRDSADTGKLCEHVVGRCRALPGIGVRQPRDDLLEAIRHAS